jgi:iron only hydrogenase large subunit-like protein
MKLLKEPWFKIGGGQMNVDYIYTEANNCQDCYKCIRECPVKAIKMEDLSASIISKNCIYCGHCVSVCPVGAKQVKEDVSLVKYLLQHHKQVIVSLAPSWVAEFPEYNREEMIRLLGGLGFARVSETALGAEIVSRQVVKEMSGSAPGVAISPCCPASLELILKYFPQYSGNILKVDTPMLAHGKYLREYYGKDIKVVFIGPCIAKKKESDSNPGVVDAVITFKRLRAWFEEEGLTGDSLSNVSVTGDEHFVFEPVEAGRGILYPITGGMIAGVKNKTKQQNVAFMSFSGVNIISSVLNDLPSLEKQGPVFLELMSCTEGCIDGPGVTNADSVAVKRARVLASHSNTKLSSENPIVHAGLFNAYDYTNPVQPSVYTESEISETLHSIGKQNKEDELNCGGCGYECCRDFAKAVLDGNAERTMCVSYMRRVAQDKATVLLQRMPYGVVIVDKKMRILESNRVFAEMAGEDVLLAEEARPGLEGADLTKVIPFHHYFQNLFDSGETVLEKDVKTGSQLFHLSIFTLDGRNQLCGILHNLRTPELNREEIVKRTRKVVRENLETVQKIAFHLGENASNMETLLNSIVDIQNDNGED